MRHTDWRALDLDNAVWRKSTYSGHQSDCVQVADGLPDLIPLRDSKAPDGPTLFVPTGAWGDFIRNVKDERFG
ncbi:DUF397 domain-containing protein [Streptomyces olivoreticuli]|uniref:DUF397 domain-containing protein n=1 Tax=Streptomyces olivoreticuli TaxID=68246 RepID=UPI000E270788|nr:DUF397 domain-containing protein [Streptomyces olivoreticuli]